MGSRQSPGDIEHMIANAFEIRQHFRIQDTGLSGAGPLVEALQLMLAEVHGHIVNLLLHCGSLRQLLHSNRRKTMEYIHGPQGRLPHLPDFLLGASGERQLFPFHGLYTHRY